MTSAGRMIEQQARFEQAYKDYQSINPATQDSYRRRVLSEAVGPIRLNLLGGTKTGEPIRLNLLGAALKVLTTNLYIYWGQRQGSLGL